RRGCGSGKWLIQSAGVRDRAGRAEDESRPAVPSRARLAHLPLDGLGVGEELAIDGVGDAALQAAQRLHRLLALGPLAPVVGPALGLETDLADRGDVDHVVGSAVPGA